ncbi:MAG TPA: molybdopterin-binding protein [Azospirillum sp.]|nr:molybdopterin-binding protein [Azospirillum sp.]
MFHPPPHLPDVRGRGFAARSALSDAVHWLEPRTVALPAEEVAVAAAAGRVLAADVAAPIDLPPADRAARDGMAVAAEATLGAGGYNPILLMEGQAVPVSSGEPLPPGTDAVLPVEATQASPLGVEALDALPAGSGVERRGDQARAGAVLLPAGRVLRPQDVGLLAGLGMERVAVVRRPRVRILLAGGPRDGRDADAALLAALVRRDGGVAEVRGPFGRAELVDALRAPGADLLLVCGRTGLGADDEAPLALAEAGTLALHGLALRPGDSAGLGRVGDAPVVLLPGEPAACATVYDLLAGGAVRRLGGRPVELPYAVRRVPAARKLVSEIGFVEVYRVRLTDAGAEPVASAAVPGLAALARADGFVLIPAESEGVPEGGEVAVWMYDAPAEAL